MVLKRKPTGNTPFCGVPEKKRTHPHGAFLKLAAQESWLPLGVPLKPLKRGSPILLRTSHMAMVVQLFWLVDLVSTSILLSFHGRRFLSMTPALHQVVLCQAIIEFNPSVLFVHSRPAVAWCC